MRGPRGVLVCPAGPAAVPAVRQWVRDQIGEWVIDLPAQLADDIEAVASELATTAVQAGAGEIRVRVTHDEYAVRIDVTDGYGSVTEHLEQARELWGEGLDRVYALSADWGWHVGRTGHKVVWALVLIA